MNSALNVFTGTDGWNRLSSLVEDYAQKGVFILADENTTKHCLPVLKSKCPLPEHVQVIQISAGEEFKTPASLSYIWQALSSKYALRSSLLLCLGGGVITDIGGFAAATYKRGMDFVHIPTTLLAMVDAAIGGKTGIDFEGLKNQIGLFAFPKAVFCFPEFLATLPDRHLASGFAEMLKHSLISDREHFNEILQCRMLKDTNLDNYILHSAKIKGDIVARDPIEKGYRKVLNLGHTIGHAIETYSLKMDMEPLLHGEAVAAGLICEVFISMRMLEFPESDLQSIASFVSWHFPHYRLRPAACSEIISYMMNDKKIDSPGKINFSLLRAIGEPVIDQYPGEKLIRESMHFYLNIDAGFFS